jgi:hypothetical protein
MSFMSGTPYTADHAGGCEARPPRPARSRFARVEGKHRPDVTRQRCIKRLRTGTAHFKARPNG